MSKRQKCYICDKSYPVGGDYEKHVTVCVQEATRLQHEADQKGYDNPDQNVPLEPLTRKKLTRATARGQTSGQTSRLLGSLDLLQENIGYSSGSEFVLFWFKFLFRW